MRLWIPAVVVLSIAGSNVCAAPEGSVNSAVAARDVFRARCAECHGPNLQKPKGRFGYVLDLRRLASNPELVIAGKPDESELLQIVCRNEMPPSKALSPEEKDTIRAWIAAGAPPLPQGIETASDKSSGWEPPDDVRRILADAGRFHLLLLHFPIALLIAAAIADLWATARKQPGPAPAVRFCALFGAAAAVPTAALGWAYAAAGNGLSQPATLMWHRWLGTAVAVWAVATAAAVERGARRGTHGSAAQLMVLLAAFLVGVAAYFGGNLIHGEIFLDW